jgi:hypothetical protein
MSNKELEKEKKLLGKNPLKLITKRCPQCGRFMEHDDMELEPPYFHFICDKCDMFYCFESDCHCCDDGEVV